jgi:hypothetical protein
MPVPHQPIGKVDTGDGADRYGAPILVAIDLNALDPSAGYEDIKVVRGLLPAAIVFAVVVPTKLIAFWRINTPESNARP